MILLSSFSDFIIIHSKTSSHINIDIDIYMHITKEIYFLLHCTLSLTLSPPSLSLSLSLNSYIYMVREKSAAMKEKANLC